MAKSKIIDIIIIIVFIVPSLLSLMKVGFFGISDDMHVAWLQQMEKIVSEKQIPPRYVPDLSFGFGYPLFNFISPLPYYLGVVVRQFGFDYVSSIKFLFTISLLISAVSMYLLVDSLSGRIAGVASALIYVYTPYRFTDIYVRGALGESFSFIFLPLIVFFIIKISENKSLKKSLRWVGGGALAIGGLILSHNIVSYMFVFFVLVLCLFKIKKNFNKFLLMFGLGLLISIYFWLPVIRDSRLMTDDKVFNYYDHFPALKQLLIPYFGYGASVPGNYDIMSFFVGESNLLIIAISFLSILIKLLRKKDVDKVALWGLFVLIVSFLMMNYRSYFIWEYLPLIKYFQFPWRFLTMTTFVSSLLIFTFNKGKYRNFILVVLVLISIGFNINRAKPFEFLDRQDNYYLNKYIPVPEPSSLYLNLKEEYLRLPISTSVRPNMIFPRVYGDNIQIDNYQEISSTESKFTTESSKKNIFNYNKYFFPGWEVLIDNSSVGTRAGKPYGQLQFDVQPGTHEVVVRFRETNFNIILDLISLISIIISLLLVLKSKNLEN